MSANRVLLAWNTVSGTGHCTAQNQQKEFFKHQQTIHSDSENNSS